MSWIRAAGWSLAATLVAMGLMFWVRAAFQVRTLPERMMEWLLLFVPLDAFEQGIRTFGPQAKVLALYGGVGAMAAMLVGLGVLALRRRWPATAILGLALLLYVMAMAGVMPLTGGGLFASSLLHHPLLVNGAYLGLALAYASVLLAGQAERGGGATAAGGRRSSRRGLVVGAAGSAAAFAVALRQGAVGARVGSGLPLAQLPAEPLPAPTPTPMHPGMAEAPTALTPELLAQATAAATGGAVARPPDRAPAGAVRPGAVTAAEPTRVPAAAAALPAPAPARQLARDQDGALLAAARVTGELGPVVTPIQAHYVVTKNAVADPVLDAESWRLVVDGEVNRPVQIDYPTLRRLPAVELHKTLECISNFTAMCHLTFFGCDLISTAQWRGARLRDVLDLGGGLKPGVASLQMQGADEYSSSIPPQLALDPDTLLVYEMNGQVLPRQHGHPARLLVPGRYGMKSAKWVVGIRALRAEHVDWYGQRGWSRTGIVKTMSRIDVPADGARLPPGRHRVAGIAYAGDRGIAGVEFSGDGGRAWHPTLFLEPALGRDTWVRWQAEFDLAPGQKLTLTCRAIDGRGEVQTSVFSLPQPDGGSGRHTIEVTTA